MGDDLIRAKHPQGDLFLFDVVSAPIKDLIDTLEHPFYSLGKKPEMQSRHYRNGDVQLELAPSRKGLPTIYDKDLLIYAVSKVAAAMRRGEKPGRMVEMPTSEILQFTNRGTSGRDYRALEDALERLAGTLIKTTIRGKGRTMRRDQAAYYGRLFQIAGGKTWYNLIDGRSMDQVAEVAAKNAAGVIEARNARIAAKLEAAGITAVTGQNIARTKDGFDGFFNVKTDKGDKVVTVSTIYAGGYNIQCFHQRTLVKVK